MLRRQPMKLRTNGGDLVSERARHDHRLTPPTFLAMKTKLTRQELEDAARVASAENTVLLCALNDILNGDVKWFGSSRTFSVGVTRPSGACGGIAVVRQNGTTRAQYLEEFCRVELEHIARCVTGENTDYNRELLCRRATIESAKAYAAEKLRAA